METKAAVLEEVLLAVIRGQLPVSALQDAGIRFIVAATDSGERRVSVQTERDIRVRPQPIDIANGLLAYRTRCEQLREWAGFVLAASEIIDLSALEEWAEGDELLNGLWDASFEGSLRPETERVASALAEQ